MDFLCRTQMNLGGREESHYSSPRSERIRVIVSDLDTCDCPKGRGKKGVNGRLNSNGHRKRQSVQKECE